MDENSRFSRALKNPVVVIGLCAIAAFSIYGNVVETTSDFIPPVIRDAAAPFLSKFQTASTPTLRGHEVEANQWIDNPPRDPFAPVPVLAKVKISSGKRQTTPAGTKKHQHGTLPQFELKAIALENQERSAVINRSIVYEGEMIQGYQVVAIELQGVWLKRRGKKHLLTFNKQTTS